MRNLSFKSILLRVLLLGIALLSQACSLNVPITEPNTSALAYTSQGADEQIQLKFTDSLKEETLVSNGRLTISLTHNEAPIKTASFVERSLEKELKSRKLPIDFNDSASNIIELKNFEIINHRVSGFSPMVTISILKADLITESGSKRISAMVKRAKVPIWSMSEINQPCFNEPIELLIKELAAKINKELFNYSLTDEQVANLVTKVKNEAVENRLAYFDVYELGFSNNPKALTPLREFAENGSDYIRMAAISSLGILGDEESLSNLKSIYQNSSLWQDRGMALKAIGDIGNEEALTFLKKEKDKWAALTTKEANWNSKIIELYID